MSGGSAISTHVLDTARGEPARGIVVRLEHVGVGEIGHGTTDADGRISDFGVAALAAGTYRLIFGTGAYLSAGRRIAEEAGDAGGTGDAGEEPFYPEVVVTFNADGRRPKYHVPLLLSPFSYATYRGS